MKKAPFKDTPRVEWKNGAWYYRPKAHEIPYYDDKTWVRLGLFEGDVYQFLADKARKFGGQKVNTLGQALDRYLVEEVPKKAFKTQEGNGISIKRLKRSFSALSAGDLTYSDIMEYRDRCAAKRGKGAANSDLEVISHLYTKLIEWGKISNRDHPLRGMKYKFPKVARDRYVEHSEILAVHKIASPFFRIYIPFKLKTALDQKTIVNIKIEEVTEEGIYYRRKKLKRHDTGRQGKLRLILWDDELKILVGRICSLRQAFSDRDYLFCNAEGRQYVDPNGTAGPLRRAWARLKKHAASAKIRIDFTEHDLRAKSLSDEEELDVAIRRGDHSAGTTTSRVYRRKAEPVMPLHLTEIDLGDLMEHWRMDAHVCEWHWRTVIQSAKP